MKAQFVKSVFAVALGVSLAGSLSACGVGVEHDDQFTKQQQKDADALRGQYGSAVGTYDGTLTLLSGEGVAPQAAQLFLSIADLDAGANPDGTRKTQPTLVGRFQLNDVVSDTDYIPLVGQYSSYTGSLQMSPVGSASSTTGINSNSILIGGSVLNDGASVVVSKGGRPWGRFVARRTTTAVAAPVADDNVDRRQRLYAVYRQIEGSYAGVVDSGTQRIPVSMMITTIEAAGAEPGVTIPALVAQYRRLDTSSGVGQYQLAVSYDQLSGRISMTALSGGSASVPGSNYLSVSGTWLNGALDVSFRNQFGDMGDLKAQRKPLSGR
jgi:hypothetical protein